MISVQQDDFNLVEEYDRLRATSNNAGAITVFTGLVREIYDEASDGELIQSLYLEHYPGMTEKSLANIAERTSSKWDLFAIRIIHRIGELKPSDQIVFVGAASQHRKDAFDATRYVVDFLKSEALFWKKQKTNKSSRWIQSRESDAEAIELWEKS